nr:unnamed protein product [Spirometra erinaceieuropaei]
MFTWNDPVSKRVLTLLSGEDVPVYHVFEEEIEPVGLPENEDDDFLEMSERELDNATSTVYQSEASGTPSASSIGDGYTENSVAYEDFVTADDSAALGIQPTETWEADLLMSLTNMTA